MYSIGHVEKQTGLSGRQIRYYEEMGLITVQRTKGNQRRFTDADIGRLHRIKALMEEHADIESIKQQLDRNRQGDSTVPLDQLKGKILNLTSLYPVSNRAELMSLLSSLHISTPSDDTEEE